MSDDKDLIDLALQRLRKGIDQLLHRATARKPHLDSDRAKKRVYRLIRHTRHLLAQLLEKRQSLHALIEWLSKEWQTRLQANLADPKKTQKILAHALQCLVRCQDGLMLLTSGECRHPEDIAEASKTLFPSRLSSLQERDDGYTKLYSGVAYSGFGWDEYANETVGIQAQLIQALRPFHKDPWRFLESSTQLLDTLFDKQEDVVKNLKQALNAIKAQMINDITKQLAKPTVFTTQDKMERIQVLIPARGSNKEQKITVARLASNFQIIGTSVLPNHFTTPEQWKSAVALDLDRSPATGNSSLQSTSTAGAGNRKRRRMILEDSEESGDEVEATRRREKKSAPIANTTDTSSNQSNKESYSTGLEIRVETSKQLIETEDSLKAIKTQMGADVVGLEISRQELEHECRATDATTAPNVSSEEERVQMMTKVLYRAEHRKSIDRDENEIWDARECLRQAYMELGNHALWSFRSTKNLESALSSFEQAKALVLQQQESHHLTVMRTNDQTTESRMIGRNLLFLLAQATTNIGITLVEMALTQQAGKKKRFVGSVRELRQARDLLSRMREEATLELSTCSAHSERWVNLKADILEADKLESLVCRWLGISLWKDGGSSITSILSAEKVLEDGWSLFRGFNVACRAQLLNHLLDLATDAIFATSTAADLGFSELDHLDPKTCKKELGETYLGIVTRALKKQVEILRGLDDVKLAGLGDTLTVDTVSKYQLDHDIPSLQSVQQVLENIEKWWTDDSGTHGLLPLKGTASTRRLSRADITPRYIVLGRGYHRQKNKQNGPDTNAKEPQTSCRTISSAGSGQGNSREDMTYHTSTDIDSLYRRPLCFRKWGDELIPNARSTLMGNKDRSEICYSNQSENSDEGAGKIFPYPTSAPPVSVELKRLLEPHRTQRLQHDVVC